jgi:hypothetical protein
MNYSTMNETVLFDQFKTLLDKFSHEMIVEHVSSDVYTLTHKPTGVSFYATEETEDGYRILYFYQERTYSLGEIPSDDKLYSVINTLLAMDSMSDIIDAEFKLGEYLEPQKSPA